MLPQKKRRFPSGMTNKRQLARPRRDSIRPSLKLYLRVRSATRLLVHYSHWDFSPEPGSAPLPARIPRARWGDFVHTGVNPAATVPVLVGPLPFSAMRRDRGPGFGKTLDKGRPGEGSNPLAGQVYQGNDCIRTANGRAQGKRPGSYGHRLRNAGTARSLPSVPDRFCIQTDRASDLFSGCLPCATGKSAPVGSLQLPANPPVRTLGERSLDHALPLASSCRQESRT
jgi:hypothetical protein